MGEGNRLLRKGTTSRDHSVQIVAGQRSEEDRLRRENIWDSTGFSCRRLKGEIDLGQHEVEKDILAAKIGWNVHEEDVFERVGGFVKTTSFTLRRPISAGVHGSREVVLDICQVP